MITVFLFSTDKAGLALNEHTLPKVLHHGAARQTLSLTAALHSGDAKSVQPLPQEGHHVAARQHIMMQQPRQAKDSCWV